MFLYYNTFLDSNATWGHCNNIPRIEIINVNSSQKIKKNGIIVLNLSSIHTLFMKLLRTSSGIIT